MRPGRFADALAVIQKGRLREAGIEEIGIGAYPEGHARIPPGRLEAALDEKIAAATAHGLRVHIVSQFSFSPERILAWLKQLRACGITRAGQGRHGRPDQRAGAVALCPALRRQRLVARADVGRGGRPDRPCRARTASSRRWQRPAISAMSRRIIFPSAGRLKPPATHAKPPQDGIAAGHAMAQPNAS